MRILSFAGGMMRVVVAALVANAAVGCGTDSGGPVDGAKAGPETDAAGASDGGSSGDPTVDAEAARDATSAADAVVGTGDGCSPACDASPPRSEAGPLPDVLVLFGGRDGASPYPRAFDDTWIFDGVRWTEHAVVGPSARYGSAIFSGGGAVTLFGGAWDWDGTSSRTAEVLADTWSWNGLAWKSMPATGPWGARFASAASLGAGGVLFGGNWDFGNGAYADGTWSWDGAAWLDAKVTGPAARAGAAMARYGEKAILFGGTAGSPAAVKDLNDTWLWDGARWTQLAPQHFPSARDGASLVALGDRLVLFGGYSRTTGTLDDTWVWDGTDWTPRAVPGPGARASAAAAALGGKVVLFGGQRSPGLVLGDTWTWDGAQWAQVNVTGPSPRSGAAMASPP